MRIRLEQRIDEVVDAYFDAADTAVVVAKYEGEVIPSSHPDYGARIAVYERLLDRIYGKPRQALELAGDPASETPIPLVSIVAGDASDPVTRRLAHALLARQAGRAERD